MLFVYRLFLDRSADVLNDGEIEREGGERKRGREEREREGGRREKERGKEGEKERNRE